MAQGCEVDGAKIAGTDVLNFISQRELPREKKATHACFAVDHCPEKEEPWRLQITCRGDKLECKGNAMTHGATVETIKLQLNKTVSTPGAKAATGDISNMHLGLELLDAECMRFQLALTPEAMIKAHGL